MKCPHCNVEIACRTKVCPLCHVPFNNVEGKLDEARKLPRAFPHKGRAPMFSTTIFDKVYLATALYLAILAIVVEFVLTAKVQGAFLVIAALFYIYFSIRFTIQNYGYFSQKVLAQTLMLTLVAIIGRKVLPRPLFIYEYLLPCLYMAAMLVISIYILIRHKHPQKYLLNLLSIALLGMLPIIVLRFTDSEFQLLSLLTASLGAFIILITLISSYGKIKQELIRLFHT
ncbi:MAG: DUF6320 domain-containing protein [Clostridia bacterium]|nr:DUF6320 domain-containing protein [Clostridia bacterium]